MNAKPRSSWKTFGARRFDPMTYREQDAGRAEEEAQAAARAAEETKRFAEALRTPRRSPLSYFKSWRAQRFIATMLGLVALGAGYKVFGWNIERLTEYALYIFVVGGSALLLFVFGLAGVRALRKRVSRR